MDALHAGTEPVPVPSVDDEPTRLKCKTCFNKKSPVTGTTKLVRKDGKKIVTVGQTIGSVLFLLFLMVAVSVMILARGASGWIPYTALVLIYVLFPLQAVQAVKAYRRAPVWKVRCFHCNNCGSLLKMKHLHVIETG